MSKTNPKAVLGVVMLDQKVVLTKRRDIPLFVLPGGGIDAGESPEEAIVREVKEETGYDAKIDKMVAKFTFSFQFIDTVVLYKLSVTNPKKAPHDVSEVKVVDSYTLDHLPKHLLPLYKEWIKESLEDKPYFEKHLTIPSLLYKIKRTFFRPHLLLCYIMMRLGKPINT